MKIHEQTLCQGICTKARLTFVCTIMQASNVRHAIRRRGDILLTCTHTSCAVLATHTSVFLCYSMTITCIMFDNFYIVFGDRTKVVTNKNVNTVSFSRKQEIFTYLILLVDVNMSFQICIKYNAFEINVNFTVTCVYMSLNKLL